MLVMVFLLTRQVIVGPLRSMSIMLETRIYFPKRLFKQTFSANLLEVHGWGILKEENSESFCPSGVNQ